MPEHGHQDQPAASSSVPRQPIQDGTAAPTRSSLKVIQQAGPVAHFTAHAALPSLSGDSAHRHHDEEPGHMDSVAANVTSSDASMAGAEPKADGQSTESGQSAGSTMQDAQTWFDNANLHPTNTYEPHQDAGLPYFQKRDSSGDDDNADVSLMSPQRVPPFVEQDAVFMHPALDNRTTAHSGSADDYRSVIDDLTIENKRLKEQLKRYKLSSNRDVLDREKLFEIRMHGIPRRKKQELEATLRDFAASLGDSPSSDSARKRDKSSTSSKDRSSSHRHPHHQHHPHGHATAQPHALSLDHDPNLYSTGSGSRSKHASNSSSRSRPVDSAYASMSTGANSSGPSLVRPPFGGARGARTNSEKKVERYLDDIPQGLHPNYGLRILGDKDKKKLIVRRLEQLFTGKIGGRYSRQSHSLVPQPTDPRRPSASTTTFGFGKGKASSLPLKHGKSGSGTSGESGGGSAPVEMVTTAALSRPQLPLMPVATTTTAATVPHPHPHPQSSGPAPTAGASGTNPTLPSSLSNEPMREAKIQTGLSGPKHGSRDNGSTSHSHSNGDETAVGHAPLAATNTSAHGVPAHIAGHVGASGKSPPGTTGPEQRPTRPLDLDPDRVQVPSENMEYIRHLGLTPPEIGPQSTATSIDVSADANGWVYLNLLSNLAQLHIFNVAPDFIRQAVVEKSTKFQLSPDGQKIRWRGGTDGTKFSSDGSSGNRSQQSTSTDGGDGSDENGERKRAKTSGNGSTSVFSGSKKRSGHGGMHSAVSSSFHYKPLFVRNSPPLPTASEETSQDSDMLDAGGADHDTYRRALGRPKSMGKSHHAGHGHAGHGHASQSTTNSHSGADGPGFGHEMSRTGSHNTRKRRKSDGIVVYYSGMPFCTDLAGDSSGEGSPTTYLTSSGPLPESMDEALQGRPTIHRSSSGSFIPFRPLTDYLSLSRDEWAGLGLLGIGTVGRADGASVSGASGGVSGGASRGGSGDDGMGRGGSIGCESLDSSISCTSADEAADDELIVLDASDASSVGSDTTQQPPRHSAAAGTLFETSGIGRVYPDDHLTVHVVTQRPFLRTNALDYEEDPDTDMEGDSAVAGGVGTVGGAVSVASGSTGAFSMSSLVRRVSALKNQTAPVSGSDPSPSDQLQSDQTPSWQNARLTTRPVVVIQYKNVHYAQLEPVPLPQPSMFYPQFSSSSSSDEDMDLVDSDLLGLEDESMFASSSVISRRANPHHSVNHSANHSVLPSNHPSEAMTLSGEDGDVEAGESGESGEATDSL